jgi:AraC family L-rhamnose operon regulatory protein RhaS
MNSITVSRQSETGKGESFFSIIYISKGSASIRISGKQIIAAAPACLCLDEKESADISGLQDDTECIRFHPSHINSELTFKNIIDTKEGLSESAVLDRYFLRPFTERDEKYKGVFSPGPETDIMLQARIRKLFTDHADRNSAYWPCRQRSSLIELLMLIVSVYRAGEFAPQPVTGNDTLAARVATHIATHYSEPITIDNLCKRFDTNRNTLSKRFRDSTGSTLIEYLSRIRIDMSCRLLRETKLPVSDILYRVGFNDAAHFTRTFRKIMNTTPGAYRTTHGHR